ncbi:hypothetical protein NDI56_20170 [Haloarcula sp. S1CR25-12]|uniref:Pentapeptide repeat-containing protein n=1 Tax=Haloarcula saliterrae TaxID=2950534 RepID=A0ABU2FIG3_9EURY|nr:hypothetical protein [Haloarcula sp. S1CR25-12]MDS0261723.1 hypothetical protein [Haloarcula sp. S1CR25-12]
MNNCNYSTELPLGETTLPLKGSEGIRKLAEKAEIRTEDQSSEAIEWECPHPIHDESESRCIFHLGEEGRASTTVAEVRDAFVDRLEANSSRSNQFVDAVLPVIDLKHERVDIGGTPRIVLDGAAIVSLDCSDSELPASITGYDVKIKSFKAHFADIDGHLRFEDSKIDSFSLIGATLSKRMIIDNCVMETISGHRTSFEKLVEISQSEILEAADFSKATFESDASFVGTSFKSEYAETELEEEEQRYRFMHMTLLPLRGIRRTSTEPDPDASFGGEPDTDDLQIYYGGRLYEDSRFFQFSDIDPHGADFRDVRFEGSANFDCSRLENAEFSRIEATELSFTETEIFGLIHLSGATIERLELRCIPLDVLSPEADDSDGTFAGLNGTGRIYLHDSHIKSGRFIQPDSGTVYYSLRGATIGDIDIIPQSGAFEHIIANKTNFDGFDFPDYRESLQSRNWTIDVDPLSPLPAEERGMDQREVTYLKAKQGAKSVGDTVAVSAFFRKEMHNRISQYQWGYHDDPSLLEILGSIGHILSNLAYNAVTGYGEDPHRVVASYILLTVGISAFVAFPFVLEEPSSFVDATLALSRILVLGSSNELPPWLQPLYRLFDRLVVPGFVALLVFTLTRSVER